MCWAPYWAVILEFPKSKNFSQMWKPKHFYGLRAVNSLLSPMLIMNKLFLSVVPLQTNTSCPQEAKWCPTTPGTSLGAHGPTPSNCLWLS